MNWSNILTVYFKELKDMLRDRRTLISMIVVPTLVMPGLFLGVGKIATAVVSKAKDSTAQVMLLGGEDSPGVVEQLRQVEKLELIPAAADWKQQVSDKRIRAVVELPAGFEAGLKDGSAGEVTFYHYEGELKSRFAINQLEDFFRGLRERTVARLLEERSLPEQLVKPFATSWQNVAPPEKVGGNLLGGFVPYIIVILCLTGAMYPAMDLTAGEKERGTMETLLCSPVGRGDIVLGKFLMVLTGSLAAMLLALVSMGVTAFAGGMLLSGGAKSAAAAGAASGAAMPTFDPLGLVGVLAMVFPVAVFFSAVVFTLALFAKSYKEAQSYVTPLMIVVIMPAVVGMLPGIELNTRLALVPILNLSLVCKEMLSGVWNWHYIALIFGSSSLYAAGALALAVKMFQREDVIFRS